MVFPFLPGVLNGQKKQGMAAIPWTASHARSGLFSTLPLTEI